MITEYQTNEESKLEEMVKYIVSRVVDHPEMVMVQIDNENDIIHVTLEVDKNDLGKVIGRSGTTAWALRTLIQAVAMKLGKRAVLREVGSRHPEDRVARLEEELLKLINETGVGPMGVGGAMTSLAVHIEYAYRHPASLPLGILIQCWADRRARVRLMADGAIEVS